ncbi:FkbM family methyltransferase [Pseudoalteromonas mariniglutinosa]|uniref:FkbM family methyltransferase n=1 Tax=Pseudoalteromonas mariniglutinosa TaxID=206042 RepID=UPI00384B060E
MNNNEQVAIYGAGGNGQKVYHALQLHGVKVAFFVDLYTSATEYQGCPIYRPNSIPDKSMLMLVSVSCTSEQIKQQLKQQGVRNCLNMNEIIHTYPYILDHFLTPEYKNKLVTSTQQNTQNLSWLSAHLDDEESRKCLDNIIAFRSDPLSESYVKNDWLTQYFPPWLIELPLWHNGINFIDCGSYIGDTLDSAVAALSESNYNLNTIICFEPDADNFAQLNSKAKQYQHKGFTSYLYPCGVWDKNTVLHFNAGLSQGKFTQSTTAENISNLLPVVALDKVCIGAKANFIKMDIEGAEPQAIAGAKEIITQQTPLLAISVYHEPEHLWQIAQTIHTYNKNYVFRLHCHGDFGLEIILYAIPKN